MYKFDSVNISLYLEKEGSRIIVDNANNISVRNNSYNNK